MNGLEQRIHRTVTQELAARIHDTRVAMAEIASEADRRINEERTHRLQLADEQRAEVDARLRDLQALVEARGQRLIAECRATIAEHVQQTSWRRLRWLLGF